MVHLKKNINQKKKKKHVLLPISPHLLVTLPQTFTLSLLNLYLPTILHFIITLSSFFSLSYISTILLSILFCINLISFLLSNSYFPTQFFYYSLSLFLWIFVLSYNSLIMVNDFFFFLNNFPSQSLLLPL